MYRHSIVGISAQKRPAAVEERQIVGLTISFVRRWGVCGAPHYTSQVNRDVSTGRNGYPVPHADRFSGQMTVNSARRHGDKQFSADCLKCGCYSRRLFNPLPLRRAGIGRRDRTLGGARGMSTIFPGDCLSGVSIVLQPITAKRVRNRIGKRAGTRPSSLFPRL